MSVERSTLYFDGDCAFCRACANFVQRFDTHNRIQVVPLQNSEHVDSQGCYESILFVSGDTQTKFSSAVVGVLKTLGGVWFLLAGLIWIVPRPIRDWVYRFIGKRRHWFGGSRPNC